MVPAKMRLLPGSKLNLRFSTSAEHKVSIGKGSGCPNLFPDQSTMERWGLRELSSFFFLFYDI